MAHIKITGNPDPIKIDNATAKMLKGRFDRGEVRNEEQISTGTMSFKGRDLRMVVTDEESQGQANRLFDEFYEQRRKLRNSSPAEKAKKALARLDFLSGIADNEPVTEGQKTECLKLAEDFFAKAENKYRTIFPTKNIWDILGIPPKGNGQLRNQFYGHGLSMLANSENRDLIDAENDKTYFDSKSLGMIAEALPF